MKIRNIFRSYKTPEERKIARKELLLGLISGVLLGASFPPVPLPYLIFVGLIPYLFVITKRSGLAEINRFTYFTAFIFNVSTLYWVGSWTPDADPFLMIAGTALMFFNPLLFLIPSTVYCVVKKYFNSAAALLLFPFFWVSYEYLYTVSDLRFPWLTLANSLPYFNVFIQIADLIGAYGLSILIVSINISLFLIIAKFIKSRKLHLPSLFTFILFFFFPIIYGILQDSNDYNSDKKITVGLIQPNLNPNKKWQAGNIDEQIDLYFSLSRKAYHDGAEILFWPETALPVYLLSSKYEAQQNRIHKFIDSLDIPLLTGMPDAQIYTEVEKAPNDAKPIKNSNFVYTSYNSILFFKPGTGDIDKYGKIMLVPFGEKVPFVETFPILGDWIKWNVGISSWNVGQDTIVFKYFSKRNAADVKIAGLVCIESIYPEFTSSFVKKGAELISIVTNDSWYGNSSGPYQHKEISVLRAVENRRYTIRAANGGISCIIDPKGKTIANTEMFTQNYLVGEVSLLSIVTFYSKYPLLIPYISLLISLLVLLFSTFNKYSKKIKSDKNEKNY